MRCVYMKREQENAVPPPAPAHHKTDKRRGAVAWAARGYVAQTHVHGVSKATTNVPSIHWARIAAVVGSFVLHHAMRATHRNRGSVWPLAAARAARTEDEHATWMTFAHTAWSFA